MKKKSQKKLEELRIALPAGWGELTRAQVRRVAYLQNCGITETEFFVKLGAELAGLKPIGTGVTDEGEIRYRYYHRGHGNVLLSAEHIAAFADALKWVIGDIEPMQAPELDGYPTPDSQLYDADMEQYITADQAYLAYMRSIEGGGDPNDAALRVMCVSLYPRKGFDPERLQKEADRIKFLPRWQFLAVLMWFTGAKKMLARKYPYVFPAAGGPALVIPGDEVMLGMLSALNGGKIVDNPTIKRAPIHEALYELNAKIEAAEKAKTKP